MERRALFRHKGKKRGVSDDDGSGDDAVFKDPAPPQQQQQQLMKKEKEKKKQKAAAIVEKSSKKTPADTTQASSVTGKGGTAGKGVGGAVDKGMGGATVKGGGGAAVVIEEDEDSRLSTISEESRSSASMASKLRVSLGAGLGKLGVVTPQAPPITLAVANSGYILMSSCAPATTEYVNLDQ
jgi:hypothetical protein